MKTEEDDRASVTSEESNSLEDEGRSYVRNGRGRAGMPVKGT